MLLEEREISISEKRLEAMLKKFSMAAATRGVEKVVERIDSKFDSFMVQVENMMDKRISESEQKTQAQIDALRDMITQQNKDATGSTAPPSVAGDSGWGRSNNEIVFFPQGSR